MKYTFYGYFIKWALLSFGICLFLAHGMNDLPTWEYVSVFLVTLGFVL